MVSRSKFVQLMVEKQSLLDRWLLNGRVMSVHEADHAIQNRFDFVAYVAPVMS
eukprot:SAG31_NODE_33057_length_348_cov_1.008032_1_plen_52_part_01